MKSNVAILVCVGMLGCSKSEPGKQPADRPSSGGSSTPTEAAKGTPSAAIDVAAVNALVPPELKDKLVFEARTLELADGAGPRPFKVVAPRSWKFDADSRTLEPDPSEDGFWEGSPSLAITSSCVEEFGPCKPEDWAAAAAKQEFVSLDTLTVIKDDKQPTRRSVTFENSAYGYFTTVWWAAGGDRYYGCEVRLGIAHKAALAAFEKACGMVQVPR